MKSLKSKFIFLKVNCFRNILLISKKKRKKDEKTEKKYQRTDRKIHSLKSVKKKRKRFFLLKQKRFGTIFHFIEKNAEKKCKRVDF